MTFGVIYFWENKNEGILEHQAIFDEIKKLADIRNATFIPVRLICELEELLKRLLEVTH